MGSLTTMAAMTQLLPYPVLAGPGAEPSWNQDAAQTFLPRRRNKRVVDRDGHRVPGGHQQRHHQPGHRQAQVVRVPPGPGEEPVRPVMRPDPGQSRPGEHAAHRPPPGLREEPAGQAAERAERRGGEQRTEGRKQPQEGSRNR